MARLTKGSPHWLQIEEMIKDEKPKHEIIDFMQKTYGVKVKTHHIAYIAKTMDGGPIKPAKGKRQYHRRKGVKALISKSINTVDSTTGLTEKQLKEKIIAGIQDIKLSSRKMLLEIHSEVEKSILELLEAAKG